jgi:hypothetical protein
MQKGTGIYCIIIPRSPLRVMMSSERRKPWSVSCDPADNRHRFNSGSNDEWATGHIDAGNQAMYGNCATGINSINLTEEYSTIQVRNVLRVCSRPSNDHRQISNNRKRNR